ncbi:MAG: FAD-dependent oxidoreductase, partial [Ruthenibacterium lactatiformans]
EHTPVRRLEGTSAVTDRGTIRAQKVIVTTHFPFLNRHGSYFLKMYQHRSYVLALENAANVGGMYVDEAAEGLSFRNAQGMLLLGGGSHRTGKQGGWRSWKPLQSGIIPAPTYGTAGPRRTA